MSMEYFNVLKNLLNYIENEDYSGYDPYDALSSTLPFNRLGKYFSWCVMQIQVRNPINIRPLLGIKKKKGVKSIALILESYVNLYKHSGNLEYLNKAMELYNWLLDNRLSGYEGNCWAIHFPIAWTNNNRPAHDPSSVLSCFVFNSVFELYLINKDEGIKNNLLEITNFILKYVPVSETNYGICFSYTTRKKDMIFNANMLVAEVLSKSYFLTGNHMYKNLARKAVDFSIHFQKPDGRWNYNVSLDFKKEKEQIDFHQGFMVLSLDEYRVYSHDNDPTIVESIKKGLEFYKNCQFHQDGRSYYRLPDFYPIDIHNQATAVVTFSRLSKFDSELLDFSKTILNWTINNLYDKREGFFYFRKHRLFNNKISYMRWNQSWMLLALSYYLLNKKGYE